MSFFLYRLVRKYADVCTGLVLVVLCLQCGTSSFAYEARPYTLVLAADAMALVCWASLVEERKKRSLALAGLFLGTAIAVGSQAWSWIPRAAPLTSGEASGLGKSAGLTPRHGAPSQPVLRPRLHTCCC